MSGSEQAPLVIVEVDGAVARLTLNRPDKLNALNSALLGQLLAAVRELDARSEVRVAVLAGAGDRAFAAGADIGEMVHLDADGARAFARAGHQVGEALEGAHFPVLAAVQGLALGGGCELAMACDLLYASEKARFGQPEVGLGVIPGFGGTQRLQRRVGVGKARELVFRGHMIDATEAAQCGLADRVFPHESLAAEVSKIAAQIAAQAPLAVAQAKRVLRAGGDVPLAVAHELEVQAFGVCFGTEDQKSAMRTFVENPKAPRTFKGR